MKMRHVLDSKVRLVERGLSGEKDQDWSGSNSS